MFACCGLGADLGLQFAGAFVDLLERIVQAGIDLDGECLEGGDTLKYRRGRVYRLAGLDAPSAKA